MGVRTLAELIPWREELRRAGKTLVLTNGVFDLVHVGHVRYLDAARRLGDALVVAVDSDESVRALGKGAERPIVPAAERAEIVAALRSVDAAVIFDGPTACEVVAALQPDIYVKGGDYAAGAKPLPEAAVVTRYGGRVAFVDLVPGRSTTDLVARIQRRLADQHPQPG
ncbi:MAG: adenylyltransferase/cytidyltransferase family protein [Chloroflexota bacterium]|nr:adenylyltransferase/cytidyltransferase family protein [Dehalococcoidia bacterium]MDW8253002.1 adenylyltransferase/cytidyltransferase family protein [Chloroflexota bacterium]